MRSKLFVLIVLSLLGGVLAGCGENSDTTKASGGTKIVVGSFGFSESEVLAQIYGTALRNAGADVEYRLKLGNREVVGPALEKGEIDMVPEYLGNYLGFLDKNQTKGLAEPEALKALQAVAKAKGITVADASEAADGDVIAVTKDFAEKNELKTISDLKKITTPLSLAGPSECETRETCLLGLRSAYGLNVSFVSTGTDAGGPITKKSLTDGKAQIGRLFSSDPDVGQGGDFVVLEDDKHFQQAGNIVPAIRTTKATPAILDVLNKVSKALTTEKLIEMNEATDVDKEDPKDVAAKFVSTEKL
jgi:osmoprotectant transport system substrate-binding protein